MSVQHFCVKLIPPRPTFPRDMTGEEAEVMAEHARYLHQAFAGGSVVLFGPVLAEAGPFGLVVLAVSDESEGRRLVEGDPSVRTGLMRYELHPMHLAAARG